MRSLSSTDFSRMQSTAISGFTDKYKKITVTTTLDDYGDSVVSESLGSELGCSFKLTNNIERRGGELVSVVWDAVLRIPLTQSISKTDKIKITSVAGKTVDYTFEVYGDSEIGKTIQQVKLVRVHNG